MTKDEIGDMIAALPQGLEPDELIYRLVNWAVDREREACAKLLIEMTDLSALRDDPMTQNHVATLLVYLADSIRARGER